MKRILLSLILATFAIFAFSQTTFRPVKATITDSQGTFTSSNFDCPNMTVYDKGNIVQLSWGSENIPLIKVIVKELMSLHKRSQVQL